jgi:hypothetical protein
MTPIDLQTGFILLTGITAIAAVIVIFCRHDNKLAAHDKRFQALEERVAMLEVPEVVHRAKEQHMLKQALLARTEGRA